MRLRKIGDFILATYGVITAVDKLDTILRDEKNHKKNKELKRKLRGKTFYTDYERLIFDSKDAAFDFLDKMRDTIDRQGALSCADLYDMVGMVPTTADSKIGWYVLYNSDVKIKKDKNNTWILTLPRPVYLDDYYIDARQR